MAQPEKTEVPLGSIEVEVTITPAQKKTIQKVANKFADEIQEIISGPAKSSEPEIFIIDAAALPAEYYLRESVQDAILAEIRKDYQNTNQLPAGASLKNEVEARSGETEKISDQENDKSERGTGSPDPEIGSDNGSETGGGDPDTSGQSGESDNERGSESSKGPRQ